MKKIIIMSAFVPLFLLSQEIQTLDKSVVSSSSMNENDISWNLFEFQLTEPTKSVSIIDRRTLHETSNGT